MKPICVVLIKQELVPKVVFLHLERKMALWAGHKAEEVCTGFEENRAKVLDFYNQRRKNAAAAKPNAAHIALVELEKAYDVRIITQNVDDLHERAGSSNVLHLHGELNKARSSFDVILWIVLAIRNWKIKILTVIHCVHILFFSVKWCRC